MRRFAPLLLVALVTALAFAPALQNGFVDWDDDFTLTGNPDYRGLSWSHLRWMLGAQLGGHWQPLAWLTFAVDHALWGMNPAGYHLTALVLHVVNALLAWAVCARLLRHAAGDGARPVPADDAIRWAAAVGAVVWAIHPLRVEVVAWATERRLLLATLGVLVATLAWFRVAEAAAAGRQRLPWLLAATAAGAVSLLAAPWATTLPALLLVLDAWPLRRIGREPLGRLVAELVPLGLCVAVAAIVARGAFAGIEMSFADHPLPGRLAQAAWGLGFYVRKSLWPTGLSPIYLLELPVVPTAPSSLAAFASVAIVALVLLALRRRWPAGLAAFTAYAIAVAPALGLAQAGPQAAADRYTYLATVPLAALVAGGAHALLARGARVAVAAAAGVAALVLGGLTVRQIAVWRDTTALWTQALAVAPDDPLANLAMGGLRQAVGDVEGASAHYARVQAAYDARPDDPLVRQFLGRATVQVARENARRGDATGALTLLRQAVKLAPREPAAFVALATLALRMGRVDESLDAWNAALAIDPDNVAALSGSAEALAVAGKLPEAEARLRTAIAASPGDAALQLNLGDVLARAGRSDDARAAWQAALARDPDLAAARARLDAPAP